MQLALNEEAMKGKQGLYLMLITLALFFSTIYLFVQNNYYRNENRQLILQNDSIISVNLQLKDTLEKEAGATLSFK